MQRTISAPFALYFCARQGTRQGAACPCGAGLLTYFSANRWNCKCSRNFPFMSRYRPSLEEFLPLAGSAPCIPVWRQLTGDGLTPVSAFRLIDRGRFSFLFESVVGGEKVGRFSFLGTEPFLRFEARGEDAVIQTAEDGTAPRRFKSADPFREPRAARREIPDRSLEGSATLCERRGWIRVVRRGAIYREAAGCSAG